MWMGIRIGSPKNRNPLLSIQLYMPIHLVKGHRKVGDRQKDLIDSYITIVILDVHCKKLFANKHQEWQNFIHLIGEIHMTIKLTRSICYNKSQRNISTFIPMFFIFFCTNESQDCFSFFFFSFQLAFLGWSLISSKYDLFFIAIFFFIMACSVSPITKNAN